MKGDHLAVIAGEAASAWGRGGVAAIAICDRDTDAMSDPVAPVLTARTRTWIVLVQVVLVVRFFGRVISLVDESEVDGEFID